MIIAFETQLNFIFLEIQTQIRKEKMSVSTLRNKPPLKDQHTAEQNREDSFTNPISKTTFEALPRIYGTRKKKKYAAKYQFKSRDQSQDERKQRDTPGPYHYQQPARIPVVSKLDTEAINDNSTRRHKTQMRSYDKKYTEQLSQPRKEYCNKRYCFCNKEHNPRLNQSSSKIKIKNKPSKVLTIRLPQLQKSAQPLKIQEEVETKHKVAMGCTNRDEEGFSERNHMTLLEFLRSSQRQGLNRQNKVQTTTVVQPLQKKTEKKSVLLQYPEPTNTVSVQTQFQEKREENGENNLKGQTSPLQNYLPKKSQRKVNSSNSIRSEHQGKVEEDPLQAEQRKLSEDNPRFKLQKLRAQFKQIAELDSQQEDGKSVYSSLSSASISKHVFDSDKKVNTMFHVLKSKKTSSARSSKLNDHPSEGKEEPKQQKTKKKPVFQKKNGLFVIPQEDQFVEYLKNYKPINEKFTIKKLVRKQNFKVVPSEDGVYFGQFVEEKRNGKGLMVTEREVFEGHYRNDEKTYGCQRNIDGVYKGEFVNGIREGYGSFQWYNGQVFEGEWKNGTKNGFGIWKSPRGDFYEGNWLLNRQHGKGIYKHKLSTYRGQFSEFLKQGQGQQIFSNGDKYVGTYYKGKPHGSGKYSWADGSVYQGQFESGVRQGKGRWMFNNGTIYEGEFKNDFKDGYGVQSYKTGEKYEGIFRQGQKYQGTLYDQNKIPLNINHNE